MNALNGRKTARFLQALVLGCLFIAPSEAQRHLPDLQIFESEALLLVDTRAEEPAVYNGVASAPAPKIGQQLELQLFVPQAAGQEGFGLMVKLEDLTGKLEEVYRVSEAYDWTGRPLGEQITDSGLAQGAFRFRFARIPAGGHVATLSLEPLKEAAEPPVMIVRASITIVSDPPRRVWTMTGAAGLGWL